MSKMPKTEGELARFIKKEVQRPDVVPVPAIAPIALIKEPGKGAVTDADFPNPPRDRTLAIQFLGEAAELVCRIGGVWTVI